MARRRRTRKPITAGKDIKPKPDKDYPVDQRKRGKQR